MILTNVPEAGRLDRLHKSFRPVCRSVIDHDHFEIVVHLIERAPDCLAEIARAVVREQYDAHERMRGRGRPEYFLFPGGGRPLRAFQKAVYALNEPGR